MLDRRTFAAEQISGVEFTPDEREQMVQGLNRSRRSYEAVHEQSIPNGISPAVRFDPVLPGSISFMGKLFGEADMLRVAKAWQDATGYHLERPPLFG